MRSREHGGFSNYAGGGDRDRDPRGYGAHAEEADGEWRPSDQSSSSIAGARDVVRRGGTDMGFGEPGRERYSMQNRGPHYGKGPKGYRRADDRIREEICEIIARQGWVDASDVEVLVDAGVVRLAGTVLTRQDKRELENMIEHVHGVEDVCNELRLANASPPSVRRTKDDLS